MTLLIGAAGCIGMNQVAAHARQVSTTRAAMPKWLGASAMHAWRMAPDIGDHLLRRHDPHAWVLQHARDQGPRHRQELRAGGRVRMHPRGHHRMVVSARDDVEVAAPE